MKEEVYLQCECGFAETVDRIDGELMLPASLKEVGGKVVHIHKVITYGQVREIKGE